MNHFVFAINDGGIVFPSQQIKDIFIGNNPLEWVQRTSLVVSAKTFLDMALQLISDIYSSPVLTIVFTSSFAFLAVRLVKRLKKV